MAFFLDFWDKIFSTSEKDYVVQLAKERTEPPFYVIPMKWLLAWLKYVDGRGCHPGEITYECITPDD
jgi:hypothetical protein